MKECLASNPNLCENCLRVCAQLSQLRRHEYAQYKVPHVETHSDLVKSAEKGCAFCLQFLLDVRNQYAEFERERGKFPGREEHWSDDRPPVQGYVFMRENREDYCTLWLEFRLVASPNHEEISPLGRPKVEGIPLSLQKSGHDSHSTLDVLPIMKEWIRTCKTSHQICKAATRRTSPTRLVSVDSEPPRIVLAQQLGQNPAFATLSHCWGSSKFLTLKKDNLMSFQSAIPPEALSKTFSDAILLCRQLDLHYIWIDSLCIVQDDPEDWRREAATMSDIYGGSSLNIAATAASDGSVGIIFDRTLPNQCLIKVVEQEKEVEYDVVALSLYRYSIEDSPLLERAWTFQERLLPARTLQFTSTQVFWECHEQIANEQFPSASRFQTTATNFFDKTPVTRDSWQWIVKTYSGCKLTYASDKLVAISGLARHIQSLTNDEYYAGLWKTDIEMQLCWRHSTCIMANDLSESQLPFGAPSWSWASVDGTVFFTTDAVAVFAKVLSANIVPVSDDNFGAISYGALDVACKHLICGKITPSKGRGAQPTISAASVSLFHLISLMFDHNIPATWEVTPAYLLAVYDKPDSGPTIGGLLLLQVDGHKGTYQRVGHWMGKVDEHTNTYFARKLPVMKDVLESPEWLAKDEDYARITQNADGETEKVIILT